jgi:hypothetical protein
MNTNLRWPWQTPAVVALTAAAMTLLAPTVYLTLLVIGHYIAMPHHPLGDTLRLGAPWCVAPGSVLLAGLGCAHLRAHPLSLRQRLRRGALLGAGAGWVNVYLSAVFLGLVDPSRRVEGYIGILEHILLTAPFAVMWGWVLAPIFVPCGALLGFWVGGVAQLGLTREVETKGTA